MAEIGVEIHALDRSGRGIKQAEKSMGRLKTAVRGVTSVAKTAAFGIGAIAIAGAGIGAAIGAQFVGAGKELVQFSNRTGHAVEQLGAMKFAAERAGYELEDMIDVTEEMRIKANDAAEGSEDMAARFAELGINVQEFLKLSPDEQFNATAEALHNVEDATRRTILADELLSDTGKRLLEVIGQNEDGFEGLAEHAAEAGRIMSTETATAANELNTAWKNLTDEGMKWAGRAFTEIAPHITNAIRGVHRFTSALIDGGGLSLALDTARMGFDNVKNALGEGNLLGALKVGADAAYDFADALGLGGIVDGAIEKITGLGNSVNQAKLKYQSFNTTLNDTAAPITTVIEQIRAIDHLGTGSVYVPHPVLTGLQGDVNEIAAALDPGLKEKLEAFSGTRGTQLTAPIQEIADTIPAVRKAFEDETPRLTAAISGYTKATGDIEDVGLTVGEVRDKTDLNVRAMTARLGPIGFPVAALWSAISDGFGTGRTDTIAEVAGMNTDLELELGGSTAMGGTLGGITIFAALASIAWGTVSGVFGDGRKDTVAEVSGMNTDLESEVGETPDVVRKGSFLLTPVRALFTTGFRLLRWGAARQIEGMNTDLKDRFDLTSQGMKFVAGILTGDMELVSSAFSTGAADSAAAADELNTGVNVSLDKTSIKTNSFQQAMRLRWWQIARRFTKGTDDSVDEIADMVTGVTTETGNVDSGLSTWAKDNLGPGWKVISDAFNLGRTDSVGEVTSMNTDLALEADTTNKGLVDWALQLATDWLSVSDEFGTGRKDSVGEVDGMNTDLQLRTGSTITGINIFSGLANIAWSLVSGEFGTGRTNSNAEVEGLNDDLGTSTGDIDTTMRETWATKIKNAFLNKLVPEWKTGKENSIAEIEGIGLHLDEEVKGSPGTAAEGVDLWALLLHKRLQDMSITIAGPVGAIIGVIGGIVTAINAAKAALSNLNTLRSQVSQGGGITPRSSGGAPGPLHGGIGGRSGRGGGGGPNEQMPYALASGGIVTQPTFALIGEAGPEAVIPLSGGGGPFGRNVVVNVYVGGSVVSEHELHNRITRSVNEAIRHEAI